MIYLSVSATVRNAGPQKKVENSVTVEEKGSLEEQLSAQERIKKGV